MYTIEQAEEHFRENLRNLIGEWATEENFYENLICAFDSEYLDETARIIRIMPWKLAILEIYHIPARKRWKYMTKIFLLL